jgi:hypothetical protein
MVLPEQIPLEIVIRGTEAPNITVEEFANFLRDLVFLHDRLWMIGSEAKVESTLGKSFFYTRNGRPVPASYQLQLLSIRKESPFEAGILIGSALGLAPAAWIFFRILRGALLLPGEIEKQDVEIDKGKAEIEKLNVEKVKTAYEIEEKRRLLQDARSARGHGPSIIDDLQDDLRELSQTQVESFEERVHLVERDVRRLTEHEIVVTEITVRRYVKVESGNE